MKRGPPGLLMPQSSRPRTMEPHGYEKGRGKGEPVQVGMAMKLLLDAKEASAFLGPGGAHSREIQAETGTKLHISRRGEYYPGTQLQELTIKGDTCDAVTAACLHAIAKVVEGVGRIAGGDPDMDEGAAKTRVVVPVVAARALIGKGGSNIKALRENTGCKVHIDENAFGGGDLAEQVVSLYGSLEGCQAGRPNILEKVAEVAAHTPWFSSWAGSSNAGKGEHNVVVTNVGKGGKKGDSGGGFKGPSGGGGALGPPSPAYEKGYEKGGYDKGYDKGGYDKGGYDKGGGGYDKGGFDKGYDKGGYGKGKGAPKGPPKGGFGSSFKGWGKEDPVQNGWGGGGGGYEPPPPAIGDQWGGGASSSAPDLDLFAAALQRLPPGSHRDRHQKISFPIAMHLVSPLIGKGGAGTKEITALTGAKLMIRETEGNEQEKTVVISGSIAQVAAAYIHVASIIAQLEKEKGKGDKGKGKDGKGKDFGHKGGYRDREPREFHQRPPAIGAPPAAAAGAEEQAFLDDLGVGQDELYDPLLAELRKPAGEMEEWPME